MFVPSGLGYYNIEKALIPAYSPLIFTFSLKRLRYRDHDGDKILSKYEYGPDLSEDAIDTDGDDYYDYLDVDRIAPFIKNNGYFYFDEKRPKDVLFGGRLIRIIKKNKREK